MIPRYSRPEMVAVWAPEAKFRIWFEIAFPDRPQDCRGRRPICKSFFMAPQKMLATPVHAGSKYDLFDRLTPGVKSEHDRPEEPLAGVDPGMRSREGPLWQAAWPPATLVLCLEV